MENPWSPHHDLWFHYKPFLEIWDPTLQDSPPWFVDWHWIRVPLSFVHDNAKKWNCIYTKSLCTGYYCTHRKQRSCQDVLPSCWNQEIHYCWQPLFSANLLMLLFSMIILFAWNLFLAMHDSNSCIKHSLESVSIKWRHIPGIQGSRNSN